MKQLRKLGLLLSGFKKKIFFLMLGFVFLSILDLFSLKLISLLASTITNPNISFYGRDFFEAKTNISPFLALYIFIGLVFTIKFSYALLISHYSSSISESVLFTLRDKLYLNLLNSEYFLYLKKGRSEYLNTIFTITSSFCNGFLLSTLKMLSEIMISFSIIIYLLIYNTLSIAIISSLFISFVFFYDLFIRKHMNNYGNIINKNNNDIISLINETVDGFKEIRIFNASNIYYKNFNDILNNLSNTNIISQFLIILPRYILEYVLILSFIIYTAIHFNMDAGQDIILGLSVLGYSAMRLLPSFSAISNGLSQFRSGKSNIDMLYDELSNYKKEIANPIATSDSIYFNKIELKNISVNYGDKIVLNDIALTVNKGSIIGIIGKSGAGKTTFINVILGLLTPASGETLVNGRQISLASSAYQDILAIVSQNNFIPKGTVDNAITFKSNSIRDKLNEVASKASMTDFIASLGDDFDHLLDENAKNTSGGQAQRIAIARALYFNRQLLVLDEPTSSLDHESEKSILENLASLKGSLTIIMVTHKKECIRICDEVYELLNSKLIKIK